MHNYFQNTKELIKNLETKLKHLKLIPARTNIEDAREFPKTR